VEQGPEDPGAAHRPVGTHAARHAGAGDGAGVRVGVAEALNRTTAAHVHGDRLGDPATDHRDSETQSVGEVVVSGGRMVDLVAARRLHTSEPLELGGTFRVGWVSRGSGVAALLHLGLVSRAGRKSVAEALSF